MPLHSTNKKLPILLAAPHPVCLHSDLSMANQPLPHKKVSAYVSVSPKARSNMSFSSSVASGSRSYCCWSSTMTWQVEHARDPSHAPVYRNKKDTLARSFPWLLFLMIRGTDLHSRSMSLLCATSMSDIPGGTFTVVTEPSFSSVKVMDTLHTEARRRSKTDSVLRRTPSVSMLTGQHRQPSMLAKTENLVLRAR